MNWICTLSWTETYLRVMLCGTGIALFSRATSKIRSGSILAMGSKWNQIGNIFYAAVVYSSGAQESLSKIWGGQSLELLTDNQRKSFCFYDNSVKTWWGKLMWLHSDFRLDKIRISQKPSVCQICARRFSLCSFHITSVCSVEFHRSNY